MDIHIFAQIFGIFGPIGMALVCIKYARTRKNSPMYKLAYLAAIACLVPMAKVLTDLMEGASELLIGVTVLAVFAAIVTIANMIWQAKEDEEK